MTIDVIDYTVMTVNGRKMYELEKIIFNFFK